VAHWRNGCQGIANQQIYLGKIGEKRNGLETAESFWPVLVSCYEEPLPFIKYLRRITMFYVKNVPLFERILRALLGIALVAIALFMFLQPARGAFSGWLALVLLVSGLFAAATGFVGWCPACAMVGRKLKSNQRVQ
jgi:Protein of unknown function (DUF2892)